jgi:hypothetical protein
MSTSALPLPLQNHGGAHASTPSRRERDETYWGVIVALGSIRNSVYEAQPMRF